MQSTGREIYYESGGTRLFARSWGSGPALVLLHGGGFGDHSSFGSLVPEMSDACQLIACDIRGWGSSVSRTPADHTWAQYAADVVALLDHLDIEAAVVGGYSLGAGIALAAALRHPERVAGLFLALPVYAGGELGVLDGQQAGVADVRSNVELIAEQGMWRAAETIQGPFSGEQARYVRALLAKQDQESLLSALRGEVQSTQPFDRLSQLRSIQVPTLVIPGQDALHDPAIAQWYVQHIAQAQICNLGERGHDPAAAAPSIRALLARVAAAADPPATL